MSGAESFAPRPAVDFDDEDVNEPATAQNAPSATIDADPGNPATRTTNAQHGASCEAAANESAPSVRRMPLAVVGEARDTAPRQRQVTPQELRALCRRHATEGLFDVDVAKLKNDVVVETLKKQGQAFCPVRYRASGRKDVDVEAIGAFVIDLDGVSADVVDDVFARLRGVFAFGWTTWGNGWRKAGECWRIVVPFAVDFVGQKPEWTATWLLLTEDLTGGANDQQTKNPSRLHFFARAPRRVPIAAGDNDVVDNAIRWREQDGALLDPRPYEARAAAAAAAASATPKAKPASPVVELYSPGFDADKHTSARLRTWGEARLRGICDRLLDAKDNHKAVSLFAAAQSAIRGVPHAYSEEEARRALLDVIDAWGSRVKDRAYAEKTIEDGFRKSTMGPAYPEERERDGLTDEENAWMDRLVASADDERAFSEETKLMKGSSGADDDTLKAGEDVNDDDAKAGKTDPKADDDTPKAKDTPKTEDAPKAKATTTAGSKKWPDPMPVEIPPAVAFPVDVLPPALRGVVRDVGDRHSAGVHDMAAVAALVTCAGAIGKGVRLAVHDGWQERACLWGALVARPGRAKSPTLKAMTAPLKAAEGSNVEVARERMAEWTAKAKAAKAVEAGWQKATKTAAAKATEAGEKYTPPPMPAEAVPPPKPPTTRLVADDGTREALVDLMAQQARGLTLIKDELSDWLGNFSRHNTKGSDRAFYLTMWSGGSIHVDRIGRGAQYVEDGYLSVVGCLQPSTAALHLGRSSAGADDGLLERFGLIACPDDRAPWARAGKQDHEAHARYAAVVRKLASTTWATLSDLQPESDTMIPDAVPVVRFSREAQAFFESWEAQHMAGLTTWGDDGGCRAKLPSLVARLALVFHLVDFADGRCRDPRTLSGETMGQVLDLTTRYLLPVLPRVFAIVEGDRERNEAAKVCEWLKAQAKLPSTITMRLIQKTALQGRKIEQVQAAFDLLVEAGWLEPPLDKDALRDSGARRGRGRPPRMWLVNPKIDARRG